jgi:hypothetical protein
MPDILAMLVSERNKLNRAIEALGGDLGKAIIRLTKAGTHGKRPKSRRTMSAEARARIAAAQKARWARARGQSGAMGKPRKKFTMSPEAKAKIAAAQKARWAKVRSAR